MQLLHNEICCLKIMAMHQKIIPLLSIKLVIHYSIHLLIHSFSSINLEHLTILPSKKINFSNPYY